MNFPRDRPCAACRGLAGHEQDDWVVVRPFEHCVVYVTDRQRSDASLLVVSRRHVLTLTALSAAAQLDLLSATQWSVGRIADRFAPDSVHVWTSLGTAAGQSMRHFHLQISPVFDDRPYSYAPSEELPMTDLAHRRHQAELLSR